MTSRTTGWRRRTGTNDYLYFYGPGGKLLSIRSVAANGVTSVVADRVYFGGMLLGSAGASGNWDVSTLTDRLGTAATGYPYGTDKGGSVGNDQPDFATYTKENTTGFEYANQRYYSAGLGRFLTADPSQNNLNLTNPETWNAFSYGNSDPLNRTDQSGLGFWSSIWNWLTGPGGENVLDPGSDWGPAPSNFSPPQKPPKTNFPPCNQSGDPTIEKKLQFISNNYGSALAAASDVEAGLTGLKIGADALAISFLQWSIGESGYQGDSPQVTAENNWFGFQYGGVGAWDGLETLCPKSAAIPVNSTNACFSPGTTWGQELNAALDTISAKTGESSGYALEQALSNGANSAAQLLQAIANNGWNPSATYGSSKANGIHIQAQVNCLRRNGFLGVPPGAP